MKAFAFRHYLTNIAPARIIILRPWCREIYCSLGPQINMHQMASVSQFHCPKLHGSGKCFSYFKFHAHRCHFSGDGSPTPFIPSWGEAQVTVSRGSQPGLSRVTLGLPKLDATQRQQFPTFDVEWRVSGSSDPWSSTEVPSSASNVTLPRELPDGLYDVQVRATNTEAGTMTNYSLPLVFSLESTG